MRTFIFALAFSSCFTSIQCVNAASNSAPAASSAPAIVDAKAFIAEIDNSIRLARSGEYGRMTPGRLARMSSARNKIVALLKDHASATDLEDEDRVEVYNQQEIILSAMRSADKDRIVCKRVAAIGTRLAQTECMTVGQREARAKRAREDVDNMRRNLCFPGEGSACTTK